MGEQVFDAFNGEFQVDGLHKLSATLFISDFEDAGADFLAVFAGDYVANLFEVVDELFGAVVGVVLGVGERVVGEGVVDGDAVELTKTQLTSSLSMSQL